MHGTIENAGKVLNLLSMSQTDMGVTELAQQLGEPISTMHDLLQSMVAVGLLMIMPSGRYGLGWEMVRLGYLKHWYIQGRQAIQQALDDLVNRHVVLAAFVILDEDRWTILNYAVSSEVAMPTALWWMPRPYSLWATSARVLWAERPWAEVEAAIARYRLNSEGPNTPGLIEVYRQALHKIREDGYAYDELEGRQIIAAPVRHATVGTVGTLAMFSTQGLFAGRVSEYGRVLMQACQRLSNALAETENPIGSDFPFQP